MRGPCRPGRSAPRRRARRSWPRFIISELRRRSPHPNVAAWGAAHRLDRLHLSVLTLGEIQRGIEQVRQKDADRADARAAWAHDLAGIYGDRILPVTSSTAREWGAAGGTPTRPVVDALLAATAKVHELTLVTGNTKAVAGLGAAVVDPFQPA